MAVGLGLLIIIALLILVFGVASIDGSARKTATDKAVAEAKARERAAMLRSRGVDVDDD